VPKKKLIIHSRICVHLFLVGYAVEKLVEALRCKPEDREFKSFRPYSGPGVDRASKRNEYQGYPLEGGGGGKAGNGLD